MKLRSKKFVGRVVGIAFAFLIVMLVLSGCSFTSSHRLSHKQAAVDRSVHGFGYDTSGGNSAPKDRTYFVSNAQQLRRALNDSNGKLSRRIIITGTIDAQKGFRISNYSKGTGYNFKRYLKAYDPKHYGHKEPTGSLENGRQKAQNRQEKQIKFNVPANTSIVGAPRANLKNIELNVNHSNVIIRNLKISAPVDNFPKWDGRKNDWKAYYDAIKVQNAHQVKIDHDTLTDSPANDNPKTNYFDRNYQQHGYLTNISSNSNDVMISDNDYQGHNKAVLIGNRNAKTPANQDSLSVSIVHNHFANLVQQVPEVHSGRVEIISNWYTSSNRRPYNFSYAWGVGSNSRIYARNNAFQIRKLNLNHIVSAGSDYHLTAIHNKVNGKYQNVIRGLDPVHQRSFRHQFTHKILNGKFGVN